MTTWLPAICAMWVAICTFWLATDRAFAHSRDRLVGAAFGFFGGVITAAIFYTVVRLVAWLIGGGV